MSKTVKSYVKVVELSGVAASATVNLTDDKGSFLDCDFIKLYLPTGASSSDYVECYVSGLLGNTTLPTYEFISGGRPGGGETENPNALPASATAKAQPYDLTPADGFFISSVNYPELQKIFVVAANFTGNDTVGLSADDIVSGMLSVENAGGDAFVGSGGNPPDVSGVVTADGRFAIVAKDSSTSFYITEPTPPPKKFRSAVYPKEIYFGPNIGTVGFAITTDNYASGWVNNYVGSVSAVPPAIQGSVSSISVGFGNTSACIAILTNGNVSSWPWDGVSTNLPSPSFPNPVIPIPPGVQGKAIKIAMPTQNFGGFILNSDFTISGFGKENILVDLSAVPAGLQGRIKDIRLSGFATAAPFYAALALTTDGYVSAWGNNKPGGAEFGFYTGSAGLPQDDIDYLNANVPIEYRSGLTSIPSIIQNSKILSLVEGVHPNLFAVETSTLITPNVNINASAITSSAPFNLTHNDVFLLSSTNKSTQTITITSALINPLTNVTAATLASFFNTCSVAFANSAIGSISAIAQADGKVRLQSKQTSSSFRISEDPDNDNYYVSIPRSGSVGLGSNVGYAMTATNKIRVFGSNQTNLVTRGAQLVQYTASTFNTPLMTSSLIPSSMRLNDIYCVWASKITGGGDVSAAWQSLSQGENAGVPFGIIKPQTVGTSPYQSSAVDAHYGGGLSLPAFGASGFRAVSANYNSADPMAAIFQESIGGRGYEVGGAVKIGTGGVKAIILPTWLDAGYGNSGPELSLFFVTTSEASLYGQFSTSPSFGSSPNHPQNARVAKTWIGSRHIIQLFTNGGIFIFGGTTGAGNAITYGVLTGTSLNAVPSHIAPYTHTIYGLGADDAHLGPSALDVASGFEHCLILNSDRQVSGWGRNAEGQCNVPPEIQGNVSAITAGNFWSMALTLDGRLVAWGAWNNNSVATTQMNDFIPKASTFLQDVALAPGLYSSSVILGTSQSGQTSALAWGYINSTNPRIFPVNRVKQNKNLGVNGSGYTHIALGGQGLTYLYQISSIENGWEDKYYWQVDSSTVYGNLRGLNHSNMDPIGFPYTDSVSNTYISEPSALISSNTSNHGFTIVTGENNIIGSGKLVTLAPSSVPTDVNARFAGVASSTPKVKSFIGDTQLEQGLFEPIQPLVVGENNNNPGASFVGGLNQAFGALALTIHGGSPTIIKLKAPDKANSLLLFQQGNDPQTLIVEYGVTQPTNSLKNIGKPRGS